MDQKLTGRAKSLVRRAHRHLWFETYAPVLAIGILAIVLFFTCAAFGIWQRIGDPWRYIALLATLVVLAKSLLGAQRQKPPNLSAAKRRVELDNALHHRPLDTIIDKPAFSNHDGAVWTTHLSKSQKCLENATPTKLRPTLGEVDKYYLRFVAPALLVLAMMVGAGDNYERLRSALTPGWIYGISAKDTNFEAWIDPPEYTLRPPSYFKNSNRVNAPEGSRFVVRMTGIKTAPRLLIKDGLKTKRVKAKRLGPKSFEASVIVNKTAQASIRIGQMTKTWHLDVGKDAPPFIQFDEKPKAGKRDKLIFTYNLNDDFGVRELFLSVALETDPDNTDEIQVDLPGTNVRKTSKEKASLDLTKHKWAGKKVVGRLL
ncbi:MAG TPA: DUF4175 family protein, partial [Gammaproteobacteria bacterium]|nr:DUF4175 family protein [Gammaproteobacteria bacterium]